jgi:hypothetical protein
MIISIAIARHFIVLYKPASIRAWGGKKKRKIQKMTSKHFNVSLETCSKRDGLAREIALPCKY